MWRPRPPARTPADKLTFAGSAATTLKLTSAAGATINVQQYPLGSTITNTAAYVQGTMGNDGGVPDANALVGAAAQANEEGIFALERVDLFNILCLPVAATMTDAAMTQVVSNAIIYC